MLKLASLLEGATVVVIGTYNGAYTNSNGQYSIPDLKPGDYSVKFTYLGYAEKIYNGIQVRGNRTNTLNVQLNSAVKTLGEVEIVGEPSLIDLESGQSSTKIGEAELAEVSAKNVQEAVTLAGRCERKSRRNTDKRRPGV